MMKNKTRTTTHQEIFVCETEENHLKEYCLDEVMETRICRTCKQQKPVNEFEINDSKRNPTSNSYYKLDCKLCRIPINKEKREKNKDEVNARRREKITCTCGCVLGKDSLSRHKKSQQHINATN